MNYTIWTSILVALGVACGAKGDTKIKTLQLLDFGVPFGNPQPKSVVAVYFPFVLIFKTLTFSEPLVFWTMSVKSDSKLEIRVCSRDLLRRGEFDRGRYLEKFDT